MIEQGAPLFEFLDVLISKFAVMCLVMVNVITIPFEVSFIQRPNLDAMCVPPFFPSPFCQL